MKRRSMGDAKNRYDSEAERRWITAEVLPTIAATGGYIDPDSRLAHLLDTDPITGLEQICQLLGVVPDAEAYRAARERRASPAAAGQG